MSFFLTVLSLAFRYSLRNFVSSCFPIYFSQECHLCSVYLTNILFVVVHDSLPYISVGVITFFTTSTVTYSGISLFPKNVLKIFPVILVLSLISFSNFFLLSTMSPKYYTVQLVISFLPYEFCFQDLQPSILFSWHLFPYFTSWALCLECLCYVESFFLIKRLLPYCLQTIIPLF